MSLWALRSSVVSAAVPEVSAAVCVSSVPGVLVFWFSGVLVVLVLIFLTAHSKKKDERRFAAHPSKTDLAASRLPRIRRAPCRPGAREASRTPARGSAESARG